MSCPGRPNADISTLFPCAAATGLTAGELPLPRLDLPGTGQGGWRVRTTSLMIRAFGRGWGLLSIIEPGRQIVQAWIDRQQLTATLFATRRDAHRTVCALLADDPLPARQSSRVRCTAPDVWQVIGQDLRILRDHTGAYTAQQSDQQPGGRVLVWASTLGETLRKLSTWQIEQAA